MPHDQVVAAEAVGDHGRLAVGVVGEDLLGRRRRPRRAGRRGRTPGRRPSSSRRGTRSACRRGRPCTSCCRHVVEEHLALGVDRRAFGELVALADELPVLAGDQDLLQLRRARARLDRLRASPSTASASRRGRSSWRARRCGRPSPQAWLHLVAGERRATAPSPGWPSTSRRRRCSGRCCRPAGRCGSAWARTCGSASGRRCRRAGRRRCRWR